MMSRLFPLILTLTATVLVGTGVIAALSAGLYDVRSIVLAAGAGFVLAVPVGFVVSRMLLRGV